MLIMVRKRCPFLTSILKHTSYVCASLCPENTSKTLYKRAVYGTSLSKSTSMGTLQQTSRIWQDSKSSDQRKSFIGLSKPTAVTVSEYTPSFMMVIRRVFSLLRSLFQVSSLCEIIFNVNPLCVIGSFQQVSVWQLSTSVYKVNVD